MMVSRSQATVEIVVSICLLLLNIVVLLKLNIGWLLSGQAPLWDLDIYHQMARDVIAGAHPYQLSYMQTAGPPLVIAPFFVLAALPLEAARTILHVVNLAGLWGTAYVLAITYWPKSRWIAGLLLSAILLITFPVRFNFDVGQPNLVLMFFVSVAMTTKSQQLQGFLIGLIGVVKTHYVIALLALVKRKWRGLLVASVVIGLAFLYSLLYIKPRVYFDFVADRGSSTVLSVTSLIDLDYYNQSLRSTMARLGLQSWYVPIFIVIAIFSGVYLLKSEDVVSGFLLSLILAPVLWQHYIPVIYPLVVVIGMSAWKRRFIRWLFLVSVVLLGSHLRWLHLMPSIWPHTLLASHFFIGLVLLLGVQIWLHRRYYGDPNGLNL